MYAAGKAKYSLSPWQHGKTATPDLRNIATPNWRSTVTRQTLNCNSLDDPGHGEQPLGIIVEVFPPLVDLFLSEPERFTHISVRS